MFGSGRTVAPAFPATGWVAPSHFTILPAQRPLFVHLPDPPPRKLAFFRSHVRQPTGPSSDYPYPRGPISDGRIHAIFGSTHSRVIWRDRLAERCWRGASVRDHSMCLRVRGEIARCLARVFGCRIRVPVVRGWNRSESWLAGRDDQLQVHALRGDTSRLNPEFDRGSSTIKSFEVDVVWYNTDGSVRAVAASEEVWV